MLAGKPRSGKPGDAAMATAVMRCQGCGTETDAASGAALYGTCTGTEHPLSAAFGIHVYEQINVAGPPDHIPGDWQS